MFKFNKEHLRIMKKIISLTLLFLILIVFIGFNLYRTQDTGKITSVHTTKLKEHNLKNIVMIPGTLKLADEQYIYYNAEKGDLNQIHVTEGSKIQIGTPVITYQNDELDLEKKQNQLNQRSSKIQINSLSKKIEKLDKQPNYTNELKEQMQSDKVQLNLDLETAKLELEKNKLEEKEINKKKDKLDIKSKIKGTVLEVNKEAANAVGETQQPLVHIGNTEEYLANGVLSEYDALNVKIGQPVTIKSDVLPNREWNGTVKKIGALPDKQTTTDNSVDTTNQYPLEVKINDKDIQNLKPGFKLILEIETTSKETRALPIKAIMTEENNKYVYIVKDHKLIHRKVRVGETTSKFIEILEGVSPKEKVVTNPSGKLKEGMEVDIQ